MIAETLEKLSNLDLDIDRLDRRIKRKPQELQQDKLKVDEVKRKLEAIKQKIKDQELEHRQMDKSLNEAQQSLEKTTVLQNQAKSNDEYQAHQRKIDSLKDKISDLETSILEGFDKQERLADEQTAQQALLTKAEGILSEARLTNATEMAALGAEKARIEGQRKEVMGQLTGDDRSTYEKIFSKHGAKTIVSMLDGICQSCFVSLRPNDQEAVRQGTKLVVCPHCGHILYRVLS